MSSSSSSSFSPVAVSLFSSSLLENDSSFYTCVVCTEILKDPEVSDCPHSFCKSCLDRLYVSSNSSSSSSSSSAPPCPVCRSPLPKQANRKQNQQIKHMIANVRVRCPFSESGCGVVCDHGVDGRTLGDHVSQCRFGPVTCDLCATTVVRGDADRHSQSECQRRLVSCHVCHDLMPYDEREKHNRTGPFNCANMEPCRQSCCDSSFDKRSPSSSASSHANVCPLEPVTCTLPGCDEVVRRQDMDAHIKNDVANHLRKLTSFFHGQVTEANARVSSLTSQLTASNNRVSALSTQVHTMSTQLSESNSRVSSLTSQVSTMSAQLSESNSRVSTLTSQLTASVNDVSALTTQVNKFERNRQEITEQKHNSNNDNNNNSNNNNNKDRSKQSEPWHPGKLRSYSYLYRLELTWDEYQRSRESYLSSYLESSIWSCCQALHHSKPCSTRSF